MEGTAKLIILSEQFRGRTFELTGESMTIGRVDQRDICIKDPTVSTNHCTILMRDGHCFVRDDGSTNGTRINGVQLEAGAENELMSGDMLQVGGIEMLCDSDKKSTTTLMRTTTDIEINTNLSTQTLERIDPSVFTPKRKAEKSQAILIAIIAVLAVLVLGLAAFMIMTTMKGG